MGKAGPPKSPGDRTCVSLAGVPEGADLLVVGEWRHKVVAVQVLACRQVLKAHRRPTCHGLPATQFQLQRANSARVPSAYLLSYLFLPQLTLANHNQPTRSTTSAFESGLSVYSASTRINIQMSFVPTGDHPFRLTFPRTSNLRSKGRLAHVSLHSLPRCVPVLSQSQSAHAPSLKFGSQPNLLSDARYLIAKRQSWYHPSFPYPLTTLYLL